MEYQKNIHKPSNLKRTKTAISTKNDRPLRILVADDNEEINRLLARILRMQGCEVHSVEDGASALKVVQKQQFDILFTDLEMSDISGTEVARAIRQFNQRTIIIIMTGWRLETLFDHTSKSYIDKAIQKPFLLNTISEALEWAKLELNHRDNTF